MALQSNTTNGLSARALSSWIARAHTPCRCPTPREQDARIRRGDARELAKSGAAWRDADALPEALLGRDLDVRRAEGSNRTREPPRSTVLHGEDASRTASRRGTCRSCCRGRGPGRPAARRGPRSACGSPPRPRGQCRTRVAAEDDRLDGDLDGRAGRRHEATATDDQGVRFLGMRAVADAHENSSVAPAGRRPRHKSAGATPPARRAIECPACSRTGCRAWPCCRPAPSCRSPGRA